MGACEICGKSTSLVKALVSGTELEVCEPCSKYGKVVKKMGAPNFQTPGHVGSANRLYAQPKPRIEEPSLKIVENYGSVVQRAREKMKLSHDDLSKKIGEKESMLHHIESGHHEPSIVVAKKLEKFFGIKLVEDLDPTKADQENRMQPGKKSSEGMTLGDFIKIKKR